MSIRRRSHTSSLSDPRSYDSGSRGQYELLQGTGANSTTHLKLRPPLLNLSIPRRSTILLLAAASTMILTTLLLSFYLGLQHAAAQPSPPSTVPTDTAVAGNYSGPLRPQIHFSPPSGFMNDPNGMFVDASGIYHLYYQYNPTDTIAGNQHWGHATSPDLYTWTNQPIALFPYTTSGGLNVTGIFTGSCVIDVNNTSGFFPNQTNGVVAVYSANGDGFQDQALAYSYDDGYTFAQYTGNPVIAINSTNFRDPKVIWHVPTERWVMVVAYAIDFTIGIYTSPDLKNWTHASNFSQHGILGLQYECPNMIEMPFYPSTHDTDGPGKAMYLLYVSINPGAPLGGSVGQYFPGSFNGTHFTAVDTVARLADFGKDNYASQFFYRDGEKLGTVNNVASIAWASNWQYTNYVPTGPREGWQSAMSLPRRNYLTKTDRVGYTLVSEPWDLGPVIGEVLGRSDDLGEGMFEANSSSGGGGAMMLQVNITNLNTTGIPNTASLNFTFSSSTTNESIRGGQNFGGDPSFWLDRGDARGFENPFFVDKVSVGLIFEDSYNLTVIVDGSVVEAFLVGGEKSATQTYYLTQKGDVLDQLMVTASGLMNTSKISVQARALMSGWVAGENDGGIVTGNSTSSKVKREGVVVGLGEWWA